LVEEKSASPPPPSSSPPSYDASATPPPSSSSYDDALSAAALSADTDVRSRLYSRGRHAPWHVPPRTSETTRGAFDETSAGSGHA